MTADWLIKYLENQVRSRNNYMICFPPGKGDSHLLPFMKILWLNFDVKDQICLEEEKKKSKLIPQNKAHKNPEQPRLQT